MYTVLILVLMEDTLGVINILLTIETIRLSLNPCFNGRYSRRGSRCYDYTHLPFVLILVLMEDTLGA